MWKYSCPNAPGIVYEFHSWTSLDEFLTTHEDGFVSPEPQLLTIPACKEWHDFWDDGEPCRTPNCRIPYVRDDEPSTERR